jgi:hypothetical protein
MVSEASLWIDGEQAWNIFHFSENGLTHLDVEGQPPAGFDPIRPSKMAEQGNDDTGQVDYVFDVPLDVAQALCGFRHDLVPPFAGAGAESFEVLEPVGRVTGVAPSKRSFWGKLFSGKRFGALQSTS